DRDRRQNQEREPVCRRRSNRGDCPARDAAPLSFFLAATDIAAMQSFVDGRVRSSAPWSVPAPERRPSLRAPSPPVCTTAALLTPERLQQFELCWCLSSSESSQLAQHTAVWVLIKNAVSAATNV